MSTSEFNNFRRLALDLLAFTTNPGDALDAFNAQPTIHIRTGDYALTPLWKITRTSYAHPWRGTDYTWRRRKADTPQLEHTLCVAFDAAGNVHRLVLACAVAVDLAYEISFKMTGDRQLEAIMFTHRRTVDASNHAQQVLWAPQLSLEEILEFIPAAMIQSFERTELASI